MENWVTQRLAVSSIAWLGLREMLPVNSINCKLSNQEADEHGEKKMNIQKPVELVSLSRNAAPTAMAPVTQQDPKRHCNGSCTNRSRIDAKNGRRRVVCLASEIEYHTEPTKTPSSRRRQSCKKCVRFAWRSLLRLHLGIAGPYREPDHRNIQSTSRDTAWI